MGGIEGEVARTKLGDVLVLLLTRAVAFNISPSLCKNFLEGRV